MYKDSLTYLLFPSEKEEKTQNTEISVHSFQLYEFLYKYGCSP